MRRMFVKQLIEKSLSNENHTISGCPFFIRIHHRLLKVYKCIGKANEMLQLHCVCQHTDVNAALTHALTNALSLSI